MIAFLSNAFNDPSDPWYYVVGVLFLLLIFGALAVYIIFSSKKKKKDAENKSETAQTPVADTPIEQKPEEKPENTTAEVQSEQTDEQPMDAEKQGDYTVVLKDAGKDKVAVIKTIREYTKLSLIDVKKFVETLPATVKANISKENAEEIASKLKAVGATVAILFAGEELVAMTAENHATQPNPSYRTIEHTKVEEAQGDYTVVLKEVGHDKVAVIKTIREYTKLNLNDLKKFVETLPATVKANISKENAEEIASKLKAVGATVEIQ